MKLAVHDYCDWKTIAEEEEDYIKNMAISALANTWRETGHSVQYDTVTMFSPLKSYFARKHRLLLKVLN